MVRQYQIDVLEAISESSTLSQRELAGRVGISLGVVNSILKSLADRGWVKIRSLNHRKLQYLLTPEGAIQIAKKSYRYVKKTIQDYRHLQYFLTEVMTRLYRQGYRDFILKGEASFLDCAKSSLTPDFIKEITVREGPLTGNEKTVFLNFGEEFFESEDFPVINLFNEMHNYKQRVVS